MGTGHALVVYAGHPSWYRVPNSFSINQGPIPGLHETEDIFVSCMSIFLMAFIGYLKEAKILRKLRIRKMMAFKYPHVDLLFCFGYDPIFRQKLKKKKQKTNGVRELN